jgi:hypothetical protein
MEIETVRDAITRLGLNEVGRVAGVVSARTLFNPRMRAEQAVFGSRWNALFPREVDELVASNGRGELASRLDARVGKARDGFRVPRRLVRLLGQGFP